MNMTLSQRIEAAQADLVRDTDALNTHFADENADPGAADEITTRLEKAKTALASLQRAEKALGDAADTTPAAQTVTKGANRLWAAPAVKVAPSDYVIRALVAKVIGHVTREAPEDVLQRAYGNDEITRTVFNSVTRAASAPATTTTSGWASQLVQTAIAEFMDLLQPIAVYPNLAKRGLRLTFGRNGAVTIPSRSATPTLAGSFVAEGAPIPVRQGAFGSQTLTPKKMAVISTFTREIAEHSVPAIEGLIKDAIRDDTAVSIDTVLLDAVAVSTVRPAGLRNGVTAVAATAGGGLSAVIGDIKGMTQALITATLGNLRTPVWIMNPTQVLSLSLITDPGGGFPFDAEVGEGRFRGYPIIQSGTVPAGLIVLVDAADFVSATDDDMRFDVSDQATLHMEDTSPQPIAVAGTPNVVAAPVRSMFQTDSLALRMILPMNWAMRRQGVLAFVSGVSW